MSGKAWRSAADTLSMDRLGQCLSDFSFCLQNKITKKSLRPDDHLKQRQAEDNYE